MEPKHWSFIYGLVAGSSIYAVFHWVCGLRSKKKNVISQAVSKDDCFFFSPTLHTFKCIKGSSGFCGYLSCPACNQRKFLDVLNTTKSSLDICVYLITSVEITNFIISIFRKGVFVRIIIDKQMSDEAVNAKLSVFLKEHIPIKVISNGEAMHNKFVIIDREKLVTGSFNWTKQGMLYNYENGLLIHDKNIVQKYCNYFHDIWLSPS